MNPLLITIRSTPNGYYRWGRRYSRHRLER
jgi:hypothetical protein